ncbi:hypothetical protein V8E51_012290 [Hyaloscypha variabilis]
MTFLACLFVSFAWSLCTSVLIPRLLCHTDIFLASSRPVTPLGLLPLVYVPSPNKVQSSTNHRNANAHPPTPLQPGPSSECFSL